MIKQIPLPYGTHATATTSNLFIPVTGWMPTERIAEMRATWEVIGTTGAAQGAPAYQAANVPDTPGTATALATQTATTGLYYPSGWTAVGVALKTKQRVRLGFIISLTTGTTLGTFTGGGRVEAYQE